MNAKIDLSQTYLKTKRLILRPWQEDDVEDFYEYARVEGVGEMAGWSHHKNIEESQMILKTFIEERKTLAIVYQENNKVIGSIGLEYCRDDLDSSFDNLKGREIGYVLNKDYWGKGIMSEAGCLCN
ncbi:GNAT family N-acetyltransferase [Coprobacillaceae bacterium CR2/5/TPMF4]|nr:GNAT family N-acetyltransferase [Coprobacillaceae bacterium CR2/5/TPMF4]